VVILSGGGQDGLEASTAIHDEGGEVLVQEPGSAFCKGMPTSIVVGGHPDKVMVSVDLADKLLEIIGQA